MFSRRILASSSKSPALTRASPHLEGLCSWVVDLLVKDMMREELEQELDEGWNLDLDSDIGDKDRVIGRMQDFIDENDDILRAKDHEQRTAFSGPSTAASLRLTSTTN
ncbi:hypothetical protein EDB86DRAFT_3075282 [Lactarius hatsudake]|nr:hypothetical protein EDB86DRAFT_3075282 [Lactarius hatsudake]